jgi:putative NADH-flavin reductase
MTKVLVIGASRGIGLETVRAAVHAGHSVRALARSAESITIPDAGLEKISGDALDSDTIRNALKDVNVVVQTLGVDISPRAIFERTTLFSQSTRILVDAMKAAGVRRLIAVTGLGAGDSRGHGGLLYDAVVFPLLLKRVYDDRPRLDHRAARPTDEHPRDRPIPRSDRAKRLGVRDNQPR